VCLLAFTGTAVAVGAWVDTSLTRVSALGNYPDRPAQGAGSTWLLIGSDSREGLTPGQQADLTTGSDLEFAGAARTDTILMVHIPGLGSGTPATMVSIPRDSYLAIPGYGSDKVNTAFSVGGVTMCLAEPVSDPLAGIELAAGCQEFDGRTALGFVRSRATPRADLDRMTHQREFMSALMHRAASPEVLLNPLRWYAMTRAGADTLTVADGDHVWDLARLAWTLRGDITAVTVPIGELTDNGSGSILIWDSDAAQRLFSALNSDSPVPEDVLEAADS